MSKTIPKKYMWQGNHKTGGHRPLSPIALKLDKQKLSEIPCPKCGEVSLRNMMFEEFMFNETYQVGCDDCDWMCPTTPLNDCGESISEFKEWLEAFTLLGKPKDRLGEDLTLLFYPEDWRAEVESEMENKI